MEPTGDRPTFPSTTFARAGREEERDEEGCACPRDLGPWRMRRRRRSRVIGRRGYGCNGDELPITKPVGIGRAVAKRWPRTDRAVRSVAPRHERWHDETRRQHICLWPIKWERRGKWN